MKKRSAGTLICMAALLVILCLVLPAGKKAEAKMGDPIIPIQYTGTCGKQAKYSFDKKTCCMTISGQGAVTSASWNIPDTLIKKVVVKDGITELPAAWMDIQN